MPLATVTGGPAAPSGRALTGESRLVVRFARPYVDGQAVFPIEHHAAWDETHSRWKPAGRPDGTPFRIPSGADGYPTCPTAHLVETLVFNDGTTLTTRYGPFRPTSSDGLWPYLEGAT